MKQLCMSKSRLLVNMNNLRISWQDMKLKVMLGTTFDQKHFRQWFHQLTHVAFSKNTCFVYCLVCKLHPVLLPNLVCPRFNHTSWELCARKYFHKTLWKHVNEVVYRPYLSKIYIYPECKVPTNIISGKL